VVAIPVPHFQRLGSPAALGVLVYHEGREATPSDPEFDDLVPGIVVDINSGRVVADEAAIFSHLYRFQWVCSNRIRIRTIIANARYRIKIVEG